MTQIMSTVAAFDTLLTIALLFFVGRGNRTQKDDLAIDRADSDKLDRIITRLDEIEQMADLTGITAEVKWDSDKQQYDANVFRSTTGRAGRRYIRQGGRRIYEDSPDYPEHLR